MKKITTILITAFFFLFTFYCSQSQDTIYVPQDYSSIQEGIDASVTGNIVLVDTGTYLENINFKGKAITLASKFSYNHDEFYRDHTRIDGSNPTNPDTASVVLFISGEDSTSVLYGFTITGGSGTKSADNWINGGGIYINESAAKIIFNRITENNLYNEDPMIQGFSGAGVEADFLSSNRPVLIENNIITNNDIEASSGYVTGGGIGCFSNQQGWIHINNNIIEKNDIYGTGNNTMGGGIYLEQVNGSVNGNTIISNSCTAIGQLFSLGGGLSFSGVTNNSTVRLAMTNNTIDSNSVEGYYAYGAGVRANLGKVEIENNLFANNVIVATPQYNYGAGLCVFSIGVPGFIRNNDFINNTNELGVGGGLFLRCWEVYKEILVDGNLFLGNSASTGGGVRAYECGADFINNVFENNEAISGGAMALKGVNNNNPVAHPFRLINNSFYDNDAGNNGGAIYSEFGDPIIINSIFYGDSANSGAEIRIQTGSLEITNSNIDTNQISGNFFAGPGMMDEDPMFSTDSFPLMLKEGSPCLNTGIEEYICSHDSTFLCPDHDRLGTIRPLYGTPDLGAYEHDFLSTIEDQANKLIRLYPNPIQGEFHLKFPVDKSQHVTIKICDLQGREVAMVLDRSMSSGEHTIQFDASKLPNGIYVCSLHAGTYYTSQKIVKLD